MALHADILDQRDPIRGPILRSVVLHGCVLASLVALSLISPAHRPLFGDPNPKGGGDVAVTPVSTIPLPRRSERPNPVANPTESQVPAPPAKQKIEKRAPEPDRDAVPLKSREKVKPSKVESSRQRYQPEQYKPNQLYSQTGAAVSNPIYGIPGAGNIGIGPGSVFGARLAWYAALIQQKVAEKWRTGDVDLRLKTAPPVTVTFQILKDGAIRNVRVLQSSGNYALDSSAQRAVNEASPLPKLPDEFERDVANVEFVFQLTR